MTPENTKLPDLGIHFITGLSGSTLMPEERELLGQLQPGGIILFPHNIDASADMDWTDKLRQLIREAKAASSRKKFLVSIDHEGGRVDRLRPPITHFPSARHYAQNTFSVGQTMGKELLNIGVNLDFAPVLDILSEPKNTVIGDRAFGDTPEVVSESATEFFRGLQSQGVLACGKHFPGHGGTVRDSHYELPELTADLTLLEQRELIPFQALIREGISMIMTAHVLYPALDPQNPATLSDIIINNLLRTKMGFKGVVISDALEMKALQHTQDGQHIAKMLEAGVDMLLVAKPESGLAVAMAMQLKQKLENAYLEEGILRESQARICHLLRTCA